MHEAGPVEPSSAPSLPPKDRRTLYLRLAARPFAALEAAARREGLRPWQLVHRWIEAGLATSEDGAPQTGDVPRLVLRLEEVERRLTALESARPPGSTLRSREGQVSSSRRAGARGKPRAGRRRGRTTSLTTEIVAVLTESGEPLDYGTLAERIRERGIFTPPRSGRELTRSQIAARVSHTFYRDRFIRSGGRVALAG